uniref:NEDD4-binding protein 1 n=1 Tax=Naja naja TaxID=35670 RepID=A0A8C6XSM1_NAJNA
MVAEEEEKARAASQNLETQTKKNKSGTGTRAQPDLSCQSEPPQNANIASVSQAPRKDKIHVSDPENRTALLGHKNTSNKELSKIQSSCAEPGSRASEEESDGFLNASSNAPTGAKNKKGKDPILVARGDWESTHPPVQRETLVLRGCSIPLPKSCPKLWRPRPSFATQKFLSRKENGGTLRSSCRSFVTGVQRFLEALKTPYKLELKNEPGGPHLKYVVIDGSNVAISFLLHLAEKTGGVVVTNDNFREFVDESPTWREIIQRRLLQYTFAGDIFMVPDDPLGRNGPGLDRFLQEETSFRPVQPCRRKPSSLGISPFLMQSEGGGQLLPNPVSGLIPNLPQFPSTSLINSGPAPSPRSATETTHLKEALKKIFPTSEQKEKIEEILAQHPHMRDMNALSALVLDLS